MQILEVRVQTQDVAAQRAFYAMTLGLSLLDEGAGSFTVQVGTSRLVFEEAAQGNALYHIAITIPRNRLAAAKGWLAARTALLPKGGQDEFEFASWAAHAIYFRDPTGNILELIARQTIPNDASGAFGPGDMLCVSEIGLPVDDVSARAAALTATLGIAPYKEHSDAFAPLGDEHGLCIVVAVGRPWFPTDTPAVVAPVALTLSGPYGHRYEVPALPYDITITSMERHRDKKPG